MAATRATEDVADSEAIKDEWIGRLERLTSDVKNWAEASHWRTRRITKTVTERQLGSYKVPMLLMEKDAVEVVLNPVARYMPDAAGAVDLYLAPAYDDIAGLYFEDDRWVVHYAPPPEPGQPESEVEVQQHPLSEATIRMILGGMAAHG